MMEVEICEYQKYTLLVINSVEDLIILRIQWSVHILIHLFVN